MRTPNPNLTTAPPALPAHPLPPCGDDWWTGPRPRPGACPGVGPDGALRPLPMPRLDACTRREVRETFDSVWAATELLFSGIATHEGFYAPPYHALRHPLVFYYGHPATLYVNKLRVAGLVPGPIDADFERLFEVGVDEMAWDDMAKNEMEWPPLAAITRYRRAVHAAVCRVIETAPGLAPGHPPITPSAPEWALFMGLEHERIHLETSSVLVRELPLAWVRRPGAWPRGFPTSSERAVPDADKARAENPFLAVAAGTVELGKPAAFPSYGWDNEYGRRTVAVGAFRAAKRLVTNAEFHAFVTSGGYADPSLWSDEGWAWREGRNVKWPTFWMADGPAGLHRFVLRTIFEPVAMPWTAPVVVNGHEAQAYCRWLATVDGGRDYRLLTEAEHVRLRSASEPAGADPDAVAPAAAVTAAPRHALNLLYGGECPVDALPPSPDGFHDVAGNVWQWLDDDFNPLAGFEPHPFYDDFSTPCFDGEHRMIAGGSFLSTGDLASRYARYHFRPHFFQHAGFRVASPEAPATAGTGVRVTRAASPTGAPGGGPAYESEEELAQYLDLHYSGADAPVSPHVPREALGFPRRVARLLVERAAALGVELGQALDLGCAVGGSTFELARRVPRVVGADLSARFIAVAGELRRTGVFAYARREEGDLTSPAEARINPAIDRERVGFRRADAGALPPELRDFNLVLASNLLCRLPSPRALLGRLGGPRGLVRPGGLLLLASPYTWLERFTPRASWIGARAIDGQPMRSADALRAELGADFELVEERDLPLVIREHARKFQLVITHETLWRRRA